MGKYGTISTVQLVAAFSSSESGTITITGTTATSGLLPPFPPPDGNPDPSTPSDPSLSGSGANEPPLMGNGSPLPEHEIYKPGISWNTYALGDFTLTDSPIGDFIDTFPTKFPNSGQINAYLIDIEGYSTVHFDAINP